MSDDQVFRDQMIHVRLSIEAEEREDSRFRCTICGRIGKVGRCCGLDTREPLNDLARFELVAEERRKAKT